MKRFTQYRKFAVIFVVLAALSAIGLGVVSAQETSVNSTTNTITVTGLGSAYGEPDVAYVELGVEIVDADLATAFSQTSDQMNSVITAVTALGIERSDIQTTGINVYQEERYDPQTGPTGERVYRVRNIVRITVRDTAQIEAVINDAVNAGANTIYGLTFGILEVDALEQEARLSAVANARARAEQLAAALGVTVGQPVAIRETLGSEGISPIGRFQGGGGLDMASAAPVSEGQLQVSVQIEVTFALGQ
jgi:uncharacterized protein YggE